MSSPTLLAIAAYAVLGVVSWVAVYQSTNGSSARRYAVLIPLQAIGFLGVVRVMWGVLPVFVVVLVLGATLFNAFQVRFCARCGAIRKRRGLLSTEDGCRQCNGTEFVRLGTAIELAKQRDAAA